jgi:hypothetical protein
MINLYENLMEQIQKGMTSNELGIPFPVTKVNNYLEIMPNTMYTIGGLTGSGKSTVGQEFFILSPLDWYLANKDKTDLKLTIIYFGMERKMFMYTAKWISRRIFLDTGKNISYKKILRGKKMGITDEEMSLVLTYMEVLKKWQEDETIICFENSKNPTGIKIFVDNFAKKHGTIIPRKDGDLESRSYKPNHPNHLVLIITDHIGILKSEKVDGVKKQNIDKFSEAMREARDLYGYSPVIIQQLNRSISDVNRLKLGDTLPKLSDFAESSSTAHDSDVVIALLDPYAVLPSDMTTDIMGYDLVKLKDERGAKHYRSLHILKNSFDSNGISIPLAFNPYYGIFKDMPKKSKDMQAADYESIIDGSFFLT